LWSSSTKFKGCLLPVSVICGAEGVAFVCVGCFYDFLVVVHRRGRCRRREWQRRLNSVTHSRDRIQDASTTRASSLFDFHRRTNYINTGRRVRDTIRSTTDKSNARVCPWHAKRPRAGAYLSIQPQLPRTLSPLSLTIYPNEESR
jgi:hypothetical protein